MMNNSFLNSSSLSTQTILQVHPENSLIAALVFIGDVLEFRITVSNKEQCQEEYGKSFQIWQTHLKA